jgi:hypothetical protein
MSCRKNVLNLKVIISHCLEYDKALWEKKLNSTGQHNCTNAYLLAGQARNNYCTVKKIAESK